MAVPPLNKQDDDFKRFLLRFISLEFPDIYGCVRDVQKVQFSESRLDGAEAVFVQPTQPDGRKEE